MQGRAHGSLTTVLAASATLLACGGVPVDSPFDPPPQVAIVRVENEGGDWLRVALDHKNARLHLGEVPAKGAREFRLSCERGQRVAFRLLAVPIEDESRLDDMAASRSTLESPYVVLRRGHTAVWTVRPRAPGTLVVHTGQL